MSSSALAVVRTSLICTLFVNRLSSENTGTFVTATLAQFRLFQVRSSRFPCALVALLTAFPHSAESRRLSRRPDCPWCDHCGRGPYLLSNKHVLLTDKRSFSLQSCGGPVIPFKVGRIDAKAPVAEGFLPLPEQSTETHTHQFARMGFTPYVRQTFSLCHLVRILAEEFSLPLPADKR